MNGLKTDRGARNRELILTAQGEDEELSMRATEILVEENAGLVRSIAYRFRDRGVEVDDLVQIGTIGMIKAIRSFSPDREVVFST